MNSVRPATIIGLIQVGIIVGGMLFVSAWLKAWDYPDSPNVSWNRTAVFIRTFGLVYLFIPLFWTGLASWAESDGKPSYLYKGILVSGVLVALYLLCHFVINGVQCAYSIGPTMGF